MLVAWRTAANGACYSNSLISLANMDNHHLLLGDDDTFVNPHMLKEATPSWHSSPLSFLPFLIDADNSQLATGGRTAGSCGDMMHAPMAMKRPAFWPSVEGVEGMKGSSPSPDYSAVHEHSASVSDFYNDVPTSCTAMVGKMLRSGNEEVELLPMNEGESGMRKKRKLTGEQVRTLECSFEADRKLEAERKQELAGRLGLEPRQVAVWFQNRRARSKAKHLEYDFTLLKSKYHYMLAETQKLRSEISRLTAELEATKRAGIAVAPITPQQINHRFNHFSTKDIVEHGYHGG